MNEREYEKYKIIGCGVCMLFTFVLYLLILAVSTGPSGTCPDYELDLGTNYSIRNVPKLIGNELMITDSDSNVIGEIRRYLPFGRVYGILDKDNREHIKAKKVIVTYKSHINVYDCNDVKMYSIEEVLVSLEVNKYNIKDTDSKTIATSRKSKHTQGVEFIVTDPDDTVVYATISGPVLNKLTWDITVTEQNIIDPKVYAFIPTYYIDNPEE